MRDTTSGPVRSFQPFDAQTNQPIKKLTKGGVLRKRKTSSLARLNHWIKTTLSTATGDMLTVTGCRLGWRPWHVQTRGYGHWLEDEPVRQFVLYEKNFSWMDVWELNPKIWDRFVWRPLRRSIAWNFLVGATINRTMSSALFRLELHMKAWIFWAYGWISWT
jgi:hypothetical protein